MVKEGSHGSSDDCRGNGHDSDAKLAQVSGHREGDPCDCSLGSSIADHAFCCFVGSNTCNVNDDSSLIALILAHVESTVGCTVHSAKEVDLHHPSEG